MSTPSGSALPNPSATIGALEIGTLFTTFLFGIATIQAYHYYRRYPNDPTWLKAMVGVVWLCVVGHTTTVTYGMYQVSVTEFGELSGEILDPLPAGFAWSIMISGLLAPLVQAFFAHRIYLFSQKLYLSLICWTLSFLRFLGSMVGTAFASKRTSLQAFGEKYGWLITGLLVMGAVNDTIIAGGLCYCLRYERVFRMGRTAKPVDQFVAYTLETGVLTGITALTIFICFKAMPQNLAWFSLFLFFGELFANSLLASLNSRRSRSDIGETVINLGRTGMSSQVTPNIPRQPDLIRRALKGGPAPARDAVVQSDQSSSYSSGAYPERSFAQGIVIEVSQETRVMKDGSASTDKFRDI